METNIRCIDFFSNISSFMFLFLKYLLSFFLLLCHFPRNYLFSWKGGSGNEGEVKFFFLFPNYSSKFSFPLPALEAQDI